MRDTAHLEQFNPSPSRHQVSAVHDVDSHRLQDFVKLPRDSQPAPQPANGSVPVTDKTYQLGVAAGMGAVQQMGSWDGSIDESDDEADRRRSPHNVAGAVTPSHEQSHTHASTSGPDVATKAE